MFYDKIEHRIGDKSMFEKLPNHEISNNILRKFESIGFNTNEYRENEINRHGRVYIFKGAEYSASINNSFLSKIKIKCNSHGNTKEDKLYDFDFELFDNEGHGANSKKNLGNSYSLLDSLKTIFNPDFSRLHPIIDNYSSAALKSTLITHIEKKFYQFDFKNHVSLLRHGKTRMEEMNVYEVFFNRGIQKAVEKHYKKSYLSISLTLMAHSDDSIHPYFVMKLPYTDTKKLMLVISANGPLRIYVSQNSSVFQKKPVDQCELLLTESFECENYFDDFFKNQIRGLINKYLGIRPEDSTALTSDELAEYVNVVEMMKF